MDTMNVIIGGTFTAPVFGTFTAPQANTGHMVGDSWSYFDRTLKRHSYSILCTSRSQPISGQPCREPKKSHMHYTWVQPKCRHLLLYMVARFCAWMPFLCWQPFCARRLFLPFLCLNALPEIWNRGHRRVACQRPLDDKSVEPTWRLVCKKLTIDIPMGSVSDIV